MRAKKNLTTALALLVVSMLIGGFNQSYASGSGDKYQDAQVGLDYQLYKPTYTKDLILNKFQILSCGKYESWVASNYGEDRGFQLLQNLKSHPCSNAGMGVKVKKVKIKNFNVEIVVYCDVTKKREWANCSLKDLPNYGGHAVFTSEASKIYKASSIEIITSGLDYKELVKIISNLKKV